MGVVDVKSSSLRWTIAISTLVEVDPPPSILNSHNALPNTIKRQQDLLQ